MAEGVRQHHEVLAAHRQEHVHGRQLVDRRAPGLDADHVRLDAQPSTLHPQPEVHHHRRDHHGEQDQPQRGVGRVQHHLDVGVHQAGLREEQPHERPPALHAEIAVLLLIAGRAGQVVGRLSVRRRLGHLRWARAPRIGRVDDGDRGSLDIGVVRGHGDPRSSSGPRVVRRGRGEAHRRARRGSAPHGRRRGAEGSRRSGCRRGGRSCDDGGRRWRALAASPAPVRVEAVTGQGPG